HGALAILMGVADGIAHVRRGRNFLPTDIEDNVAGLEAVLGGKTIVDDLGHNHPFRATAGDLSAGASIKPSFGTSVPLRPEVDMVARASRPFGNSASVSEMLFSSP